MNNEQKQPELKNWLADESITAQMRAMTDAENRELLLSLASKKEWIAILRYVYGRVDVAKGGLFTLDPFKDQTQMARYQGIVTGLLDLPDIVGQLQQQAASVKTS